MMSVYDKMDLKFQIVLVSILLLAIIVGICEIITTQDSDLAINTQETVGLRSSELDPVYFDDLSVHHIPSSFYV